MDPRPPQGVLSCKVNGVAREGALGYFAIHLIREDDSESEARNKGSVTIV